MNLLAEKMKEVSRTLLPVVLLVLLLCFTIVDVGANIILRFLVGSVMLLLGLAIFLWGVDLSINPIGEYMSREVATSRTPFKIAALSFLLGFLITVAEPDLLVLGSQIETASGGVLSASVIVYIVSIGVGVLISLGVFRLLQDLPLNIFMLITYGIIIVLAIFVSEEFLAISFDASGATTGALTTPFVLAISLGLSKIKGGMRSEENSFGLVGIMSAGPILAVMLLSIMTGQKNIEGEAIEFALAEGVLGPIVNAIPPIFVESLIALLPITALFFIFNFSKFKLPRNELLRIVKGLALILIGLILFLTAVTSGFMDMGRVIGMGLAGTNRWLLLAVGFLLGMIVVLVEPAVHVLGEQIEEVTSGHIPLNIIRATLSIGVALAVAFSMLRIVVPAVKLWYFLIPGFALAMVLSFIAEPIFVGIAYDAGGVASGPMTATFVLAFAQGAASITDTANVMIDGFGVIAMVAMAPVLSLMVLGTMFRYTRVERPAAAEKGAAAAPLPEAEGRRHDCIMAVAKRGFAERIVDLARLSGATGATIIRGRGVDEHQKVLLPIIHVELQPEREVVLLVTGAEISETVADRLLEDPQLAREGEIDVFISPAEAMTRTMVMDTAGPGD
ncbi:MAG TPA: DUF1538 domain-containing protein [Firmicutes bacterium]|jgi:hypothetical protein|nr:DUF1538 domain-containing protein [Bacillota bacterium]